MEVGLNFKQLLQSGQSILINLCIHIFSHCTLQNKEVPWNCLNPPLNARIFGCLLPRKPIERASAICKVRDLVGMLTQHLNESALQSNSCPLLLYFRKFSSLKLNSIQTCHVINLKQPLQKDFIPLNQHLSWDSTAILHLCKVSILLS